MIDEGYETAGVPDAETPAPISVFLGSVPYNMYAILAIVMVGVIVLSQRDYGEMFTAEQRAVETGRLSRDDADPMQDIASNLGEPCAERPRLSSFVSPILALSVGVVLTALWTGGAFRGTTLEETVRNADYAFAMLVGSLTMVGTTFLLGDAHGVLSLRESLATTVNGFRMMLTAVSILILAWAIGEAVSTLGTGEYVASLVRGTLTPEVLPVVVFATAGFISLTTGSSWGTMLILTPIVIPVTLDLAGTHEMVSVVVGMVLSGAVFGDHCSPISDTSVLSATFTGADLIDHVRTQLYYAGTVGLVVAVLMLVWGYIGVSPVLLLVTGSATLVGLVYGLSKLQARLQGAPLFGR
jgi:Na+/H+ antiporter